jgi:hypothetical protein
VFRNGRCSILTGAGTMLFSKTTTPRTEGTMLTGAGAMLFENRAILSGEVAMLLADRRLLSTRDDALG